MGLSEVFDVDTRGFVEAYTVQEGAVLLDVGLQLVPYGDGEVLGAGEPAFHEVDIEVEVAVVDTLYDDVFDEAAECFGVVDEACIGVGGAFYGDVQLVVVAMPVGVGAFAKYFCVLRFGPVLVVQAVGGIEMLDPSKVNHCCFIVTAKLALQNGLDKKGGAGGMNILLVAATEAEIGPVLQHIKGGGMEHVRVLVTGVGMVATAYALGKELAQRRYDLVLQVGIGGSFDRGIAPGEVVLVVSEQFGDMGAEDHDKHLDLFDMGLLQADGAPFEGGKLDMPVRAVHEGMGLRRVSGLTVNMVSGNQRTIDRLAERYGCEVESMEGAAMHYVCLMEGVPAFAQVRSISNYVTPRDRASWKMKEAVVALNEWLVDYLQNAQDY